MLFKSKYVTSRLLWKSTNFFKARNLKSQVKEAPELLFIAVLMTKPEGF